MNFSNLSNKGFCWKKILQCIYFYSLSIPFFDVPIIVHSLNTLISISPFCPSTCLPTNRHFPLFSWYLFLLLQDRIPKRSKERERVSQREKDKKREWVEESIYGGHKTRNVFISYKFLCK